MAKVENQDINQTIRVEGEVNSIKVNEAFRKLSEWWSRLKAAVKSGTDGGGIFTAFYGGSNDPSYRFKANVGTGLWLDTTTDNVHYSREGIDYGEITGNAFACHVVRTSNQTISFGTWNTITWHQVQDFDTGGLWDSTSPTRLTAPVNGLYLVTATTRTVGANAGDPYRTNIMKNGVGQSVYIQHHGFSVGYPGQVVNAIYYADAEDYFEIRMYQTAETGGISLIAANTSFQMMRIG